MGLIFSSLVNKYIVDKFISGLSRNRSMIAEDVSKWRSEKNDNLTADSNFGRRKYVPRHEKKYDKVLDK
jgi:hypothetical protein